MSLLSDLQSRSQSRCELCATDQPDVIFEVAPAPEQIIATCVLICQTCQTQINEADALDVHHWRCLNECMWSDIPAVQVLAWRMLSRLSATQSWASDQLNMLYLDDETLAWAQADRDLEPVDTEVIIHRDTNGAILGSGDSVTLIKDLNVKGAGFTAKRGTAVHNISLVHDNAGQIEGRVNNQQIIILTEFVKKSG